MRSVLLALLLALPAPAFADPKPAEPAKSEVSLAPLPADRTVPQSAVIAGATVSYQATVGTLPLYDAKGKKTGEVVFTAYVVPGRGAARPVTFAFNGGPGAASAFLNYGAIGPKRVQFGAQGDGPSDSAVAHDNPNSWLDFTDLVFIDPVGTGYSRSLLDEGETKKTFFTADTDIQYLSRIIADWLTKNGRMTSPKYLVGESYGGYRVPRLAYYLQSQLGVGLNGIVMVSPALSPRTIFGDAISLSPMNYVATLPSMAAGQLERQGRLTGPAALADVEAYARGEFVTDLLRGRADAQATERLATRVAGYTGLDPKLVRQLEGRIDVRTYLREIHRDTKSIGSIYDSNVTAFDPYPEAAQQQSNDPILDAGMAPVTGAAVDLMTRVVGWKAEARYNLLSYSVNAAWDWDRNDDAIADLRQGRVRRSEDGGRHRAWHGRSLLPVFREPAGDRSAADVRPSEPRAARPLCRRPHVLQPRGQRCRLPPRRAGDLPTLSTDREKLEAEWLALTRERLPALAAPRGWPVRADHCFQRILLDHAFSGRWYDHVAARPAYKHAPDDALVRAVALGEQAIAGAVDLAALDNQSLVWRGKRPKAPPFPAR